MKKIFLSVAFLAASLAGFASQKAIYVKSGDVLMKYSFGVAGDLQFRDNGTKLYISGYDEAIDLKKVDYISFTAPGIDNAMTPSAQKEKLIGIVDDFYHKCDMNDGKEFIRMLDTFLYKYADICFDRDDYFNLHEDAYKSGFKKLIKTLKAVGNGDIASNRKLRKLIGYAEWRSSDFTGVFEAVDFYPGNQIECDECDYLWHKVADADWLEFRFPSEDGERYTIKIVPSEDYTVWNEVNFKGEMPRVIEATGSKGGNMIWSSTLDTELNDSEKSLDMRVSTNVGEYVVNTGLTIDNQNVADMLTLDVKGERLLTTIVRVRGNNLTNYDQLMSELESDGYDDVIDDDEWDDYWTEDRLDKVSTHFSFATCDLDILGHLQVKGHASQLSRMYEEMKRIVEEDDNYEHSYWNEDHTVYTEDCGSIETVQKSIDMLNRYSDAMFYYDGNSQLQGFLGYDIDEDSYEQERDWFDGKKVDPYIYREVEYLPMPVLMFPDMTSFAFKDFFNEVDFSKLVDDYYEIIDDYYIISGRDRDD